jgi:hypothetical protein
MSPKVSLFMNPKIRGFDSEGPGSNLDACESQLEDRKVGTDLRTPRKCLSLVLSRLHLKVRTEGLQLIHPLNSNLGSS